MRILLLILLASAIIGCKKNVEFPAEIRPNEFWVQYSITNDTGITTDEYYQGEDTVTLTNVHNAIASLDYFTFEAIQGNVKEITAGLADFLAGVPISVRIKSPDLVTDPNTPEQWTAAELERLLYPGKTFAYGDAPGEVLLKLEGYPNRPWACTSSTATNQNGYFEVLEISDYGAPEIGIPYFGKKVHIKFAGPLTNDSGNTWTLQNGEAVLFFRYYTF